MEVNVMFRNTALRPRPRAIRLAISTSKPTTLSGCAGSASTNGAPPSGSPAQRNSRSVSAAPTDRGNNAAIMAGKANLIKVAARFCRKAGRCWYNDRKFLLRLNHESPEIIRNNLPPTARANLQVQERKPAGSIPNFCTGDYPIVGCYVNLGGRSAETELSCRTLTLQVATRYTGNGIPFD